MTITVTPAREARFRPHAEIVASDWVDESVVFGDGRGDDFTSQTLEALIVGPTPVDEAVIGGMVWKDTNDDGRRDADETALQGISVMATHEDGSSTTVVTSSDGAYRFTGLRAGSYTVTVDDGTLPDGLESDGVFVLAMDSDSSFLIADFGCVEVPGSVYWWIGAALLATAGAIVLGLRLMRKRSTSEAVDETSVEDALV